MGTSRGRNRAHLRWRHEHATLPDGTRLHWIVNDEAPNGPLILVVRTDTGPLYPPEGRDLIASLGHPDGQLRAMHDPPR